MGRAKGQAVDTSSPPPAKRPKKSSTKGTSATNVTNRGRMALLKQRELCNTKFAHLESLEAVGVAAGVQQLFANIGWLDLLKWNDVGYTRTTLDFLSSLRVEKDEITFRMLNRDCTLSMTDICSMISAPYADTFSPTDPAHDDFHAEAFWKSIVVKPVFISTKLKASKILHPVLRIAHRLLSCILDSRADTGAVTITELYLLWCMIHPLPSRPNFGRYLCHRLQQVSKATKGQICCGSVITILGRHPSLKLQFPPNLEELKGSQFLDMEQMIKMKMIASPRPGWGYQWLSGTRFYLSASKTAADDLSLADPVGETDWLLGLTLSDSEEEVEPDEHTERSVEHQEYMSRFTAIDTELAGIRTDLSTLLAQQREMTRAIASIRDHLDYRGSHPSPPS